MGKKNIQPTTSSPVSRTLVVAPRPALEELRAEPQEGHISSLTGPDPSYEALKQDPDDRDPTQWGYLEMSPRGEDVPGADPPWRQGWEEEWFWYTSYDGDDE